MRLPQDSEERFKRAPRGYDMQVLAAVLCRAADHPVADLGSLRELARLAGCHHKHVPDSLAYWQRLSITDADFYAPGFMQGKRRKPKQRQRLTLPPPIVDREDLDGSRLRLQVAPEWQRLAGRYFLRVPMPLPGDAIVQNALLYLLTFLVDPPSRSDAKPEQRDITREQRSLMRQFGISTAHGSGWSRAEHQLRRALADVAELLPGTLAFQPEREAEHGRMI